MKLLSLLLLSLVLLSGCSTKKVHPHTQSKYYATLTPYKQSRKELPPYRLKKKNPITLALYDEYVKWYGTPYCYGGTSFKGVDCSALVQRLYWDAFRLKMPRTVKQQAKMGYQVPRREIKEGDLVLFKTGWSTRHSGIYLERGNFINASSKHGITISNLNNPYWRSKYWQTRRVIAR